MLSWLDLSPEQMSRARDFISQLKQEGVLDELGFGLLQTAIADVLYPGTTTVMTRTRYFYFIPALCEQLENAVSRKATDPRRLSRALQHQLCEVLKVHEPVGVIGREAGEKLQRFPSNIYWSGLHTLGFLNAPLSEAAYYASVSDLRKDILIIRDDDDTAQLGVDDDGFWDRSRPRPSFLTPSGGIAPDTTFELTRAESDDLRARFERHDTRTEALQDGARSLFSILLKAGSTVEPNYPWDTPVGNGPLRRLLDHAEALSAIAMGMTLQYYDLVLQARAEAGLQDDGRVDVKDAFAEWFSAARAALLQWVPGEFFNLAVIGRAARSRDALDLTGWHDRLAGATNAFAFFRDSEARRIVTERERRLKAAKSRLRRPVQAAARELKSFALPPKLTETYGLSYRHRIGQIVVRDVRGGQSVR